MPPKKKKQKDYPGQPWRLRGEKPKQSADRLYRALEVEKTQHQLAKDELQAEKERHLLTKDLLKRTTSELLEKAEANDVLERAKANLTKRVSDLEIEKVDITKRASDLEIEKEDLTKKVADLEIKIERTADQNREQIREQNGVIADLRKNIANLESAVSSLESDLETRTEAHDNERAELNQTITELQETITNNLNLHTGEKEKLEAEIEVAKEKLTDLENRYKTDKESTNEIIDTLKLEKQQHQTTIEEHQATIIELQALLDADVEDEAPPIEEDVPDDVTVDIPSETNGETDNVDIPSETEDENGVFPFIPSTPDTYQTATSYLTVAQADKVFGKMETYKGLSNADKKDFLVSLSGIIDNIVPNLRGYKTDDTQILRFPRNGSKEVPLDIIRAIIEHGKQLIEDPALYDLFKYSSQKIGDDSITYNNSIFDSGKTLDKRVMANAIVMGYLEKYIEFQYEKKSNTRFF